MLMNVQANPGPFRARITLALRRQKGVSALSLTVCLCFPSRLGRACCDSVIVCEIRRNLAVLERAWSLTLVVFKATPDKHEHSRLLCHCFTGAKDMNVLSVNV